MKRPLIDRINAQITPSQRLLGATKQKIKAQRPAPFRVRLPRYAAAACLLLVLAAACLFPALSSFAPSIPTDPPTSHPGIAASAPPSSPPAESKGAAGDIPYNSLQFPAPEPGEPFSGQQSPQEGVLSMDIAAFDERMMADASALVEGTVTAAYFKDYLYDIPSDKFEENGVLHGQTRTLVYEFKITQILFGGGAFSTGQTIRVESLCFNGCYATGKPPYSLQIGRTYVLPLTEDNSVQRIETTNGPLTPEGQYAIVYPFAPQIEKTLAGQYVFHSLWSSLWNENTPNVITQEDSFYQLKLRSDATFTEDLKEIMERYR